MIDLCATIVCFIFTTAIAYGLGHQDGQDAEYARQWDTGE